MSNIHIHTLSAGPFETNCFVVWRDSGQAVVIDPGCDADRIVSVLAEKNLVPAAYLLTHGHVDHISALAELCNAHPAWAGMHQADMVWAFQPFNQMPPFYPSPARPGGHLRELRNEETLDCANMSFHVISTPGHTPGSVCFHMISGGVLFAGDTLFAGSAGRTDLPGGDSRTLAASLKKLAALPPETKIYPGHGPPSTIADELRTNFFMQNLAGHR